MTQTKNGGFPFQIIRDSIRFERNGNGHPFRSVPFETERNGTEAFLRSVKRNGTERKAPRFLQTERKRRFCPFRFALILVFFRLGFWYFFPATFLDRVARARGGTRGVQPYADWYAVIAVGLHAERVRWVFTLKG